MPAEPASLQDDLGMASLKTKGDLAELKVAADLVERGYRIAIPFGEDSDFDLILIRGDTAERVQVKYTRSDGQVIRVRCRSHSLTNGKVLRTKYYTATTIDWIAVYDATSGRCFYVPAAELGEGRAIIHLRLSEPRNRQRRGIRYASDYEDLQPRALRMEPAGFEPATFALQTRRSPN
jgi:hypothetical protein